MDLMAAWKKWDMEEGARSGYKVGFQIGFFIGFMTGFEEGYKIGFEEGRELGRQEVRQDAICKLLRKGLSPEFIAETIDVPLEEVLSVGCYYSKPSKTER
jgi:flagellar biosynthesis/type III secretory pathway protein FliH